MYPTSHSVSKIMKRVSGACILITSSFIFCLRSIYISYLKSFLRSLILFHGTWPDKVHFKHADVVLQTANRNLSFTAVKSCSLLLSTYLSLILCVSLYWFIFIMLAQCMYRGATTMLVMKKILMWYVYEFMTCQTWCFVWTK